jgi:hypothetical protein
MIGELIRTAITWAFRNRRQIVEVVQDVTAPAEPSMPLSHADSEHIRRQQASAARPPGKVPP